MQARDAIFPEKSRKSLRTHADSSLIFRKTKNIDFYESGVDISDPGCYISLFIVNQQRGKLDFGVSLLPRYKNRLFDI